MLNICFRIKNAHYTAPKLFIGHYKNSRMCFLQNNNFYTSNKINNLLFIQSKHTFCKFEQAQNNQDNERNHFPLKKAIKSRTQVDSARLTDSQKFLARNKKNLNKSLKREENIKDFNYKIQNFHPASSKYTLRNEPEEISKISEGKPNFLSEDKNSNKIKVDIGGYKHSNSKESQKHVKRLLTPGKMMTLQKKVLQKKLSLQEKRELRKRLRIEEHEKIKSQAKMKLREERKLIDNKETSIDRYDPNYWIAERKKISTQLQQIRQEKSIEMKKFFNIEDLSKFKESERLSKRLARLGITSRRQAEKLISNGMIKVDGQIVKANVPVSENNQIQVFSNQEYSTPMPNHTKIWLFYKPSGYVCETRDEKKRASIYQLLAKKGFPLNHFIVVGKMDYASEGLIILTNSGDIASGLETNVNIERGYKIRFFGRMFSKEKLEKIRKGVMINKRFIKFWAETIRQNHSNSWVHIKSYNNSISDIRNVFERLSLRINRIIRTDYGPFRIGKLKNPGDVMETHIPKILNTYLYFRYKEKMQNSLRKLDDTKIEFIKEQILRQQKNKNFTKKNKISQDSGMRSKKLKSNNELGDNISNKKLN